MTDNQIYKKMAANDPRQLEQRVRSYDKGELTDKPIVWRYLNGEYHGRPVNHVRGYQYLVDQSVDTLMNNGILYLSYGDLNDPKQLVNVGVLITKIYEALRKRSGKKAENLAIATDLVSKVRQHHVDDYLSRKGKQAEDYFTKSMPETPKDKPEGYLGEREKAEYCLKILRAARNLGITNVAALDPESQAQIPTEQNVQKRRINRRAEMAEMINQLNIVVCSEEELRYGGLQSLVDDKLRIVRPDYITVSSNPTEQLVSSATGKGLHQIVFDVTCFGRRDLHVDYFVHGHMNFMAANDPVTEIREDGRGIFCSTTVTQGVDHDVHLAEVDKARRIIPRGYSRTGDTVQETIDKIAAGLIEVPGAVRIEDVRADPSRLGKGYRLFTTKELSSHNENIRKGVEQALAREPCQIGYREASPALVDALGQRWVESIVAAGEEVPDALRDYVLEKYSNRTEMVPADAFTIDMLTQDQERLHEFLGRLRTSLDEKQRRAMALAAMQQELGLSSRQLRAVVGEVFIPLFGLLNERGVTKEDLIEAFRRTGAAQDYVPVRDAILQLPKGEE